MCAWMRGPLLRWDFAGFDPPSAAWYRIRRGPGKPSTRGHLRQMRILDTPGTGVESQGKRKRCACVLFFYMNAATECLEFICRRRAPFKGLFTPAFSYNAFRAPHLYQYTHIRYPVPFRHPQSSSLCETRLFYMLRMFSCPIETESRAALQVVVSGRQDARACSLNRTDTISAPFALRSSMS